MSGGIPQLTDAKNSTYTVQIVKYQSHCGE